MIHCLIAAMTHNAPVNEIKAPKSQDISHEDLIPCGCPNKERDTPGCLNLPNTGKAMEVGPVVSHVIQSDDSCLNHL